jgi:hypothetical protein
MDIIDSKKNVDFLQFFAHLGLLINHFDSHYINF